MHVPLLNDGARSTVAALIGMSMISPCYAGGVRPDAGRRISETPDIQSIHFSESLHGTEMATVMEAGGFKLTASCKTITFTYESLYGGYSSSTSSMHTFPSSYYSSSSSFDHSSSGHMGSFHGSHHSGHPHGSEWSSYSSMSSHSPEPVPGGGDGSSPSGGSSSVSSAAPTDTTMLPHGGVGETGSWMNDWSTYYTDDSGHDGYYFKHTDDGDGSYSYNFREEYNHTESFAALELTYTASDEDYLYGHPSFTNYPNETLVTGNYESGESRTQIVFAGRDGSFGDSCTLQSTSGNYVSIGQSTVGVHRSWVEGVAVGGWIRDPENTGVFPDGVDCMVAGVVTFVASDDA